MASIMGTEVELKSDGEDILHILGGKKAEHAPKLVSDKVQTVDLHEGDWGDHGSIKSWTYIADGKEEVYKEKVTIDEENKTVHLTAIEGHCLDLYKTYNLIFQIITKADDTKAMKITIEYEKLNDDVPPPQKYLDFLIASIQDLDSKLPKA